MITSSLLQRLNTLVPANSGITLGGVVAINNIAI
jgi:hypothetical protein